jgi:hypothetical protein
MIFNSNVDDWWNLFAKKDLWATTNVLNYKGEVVTSDFYRKTFTSNKIPNIYSAFFYFKKSPIAERFFEFLELIFKNWDIFIEKFFEDDKPGCFSTDVAYGLAAKLTGLDELMCNSNIVVPTFVHMKSKLQNVSYLGDENWSDHLNTYFDKKLQFRIVNHLQTYPVHYHLKDWLTDEIITYYEKAFFND